MYDNYNYPEGSDTPNAPWNEVHPPKRNFAVTVVQTIVKDDIVNTDMYYEETDEYGCHDIDTTEVDWMGEWESAHESVLQLLARLELYARQELAKLPVSERKKRRYWQQTIEDCTGWRILGTEVDEK